MDQFKVLSIKNGIVVSISQFSFNTCFDRNSGGLHLKHFHSQMVKNAGETRWHLTVCWEMTSENEFLLSLFLLPNIFIFIIFFTYFHSLHIFFPISIHLISPLYPPSVLDTAYSKNIG